MILREEVVVGTGVYVIVRRGCRSLREFLGREKGFSFFFEVKEGGCEYSCFTIVRGGRVRLVFGVGERGYTEFREILRSEGSCSRF